MLACAGLSRGAFGADQTSSPSPTTNEVAAPKESSSTLSSSLVERLKSINISPAAKEIVRLSDAGMEAAVLQAYVENSSARDNPKADDILYLHEHGIPGSIIAAIIQRAAKVREQTPPEQASPAPQPAQPPPASASPRSPVVISPTYVAPVIAPTYVVPAVSPTYVYPSFSDYGYTSPYYNYVPYSSYSSYGYWPYSSYSSYSYCNPRPRYYARPQVGFSYSFGGYSHRSYGHGGGHGGGYGGHHR